MEKNKKIYLFIIISIIIILISIMIQNYNSLTYSYIYEKNALSELNFKDLLSLCKNISNTEMSLDPKATNRLMYQFTKDNELTLKVNFLLFNKSLIEKIRDVTGNQKLVPCLEVPVEYRKYSNGSYMNWHFDTKILEDQYQYECVLTLTNTSDSLTIMNRILYNDEISSEPNSLMIVRAHGILHKVTETTKGERTILKFVLYEE